MSEKRKPKMMRRYSYDPGSTVIVEIGEANDFGDVPVFHADRLIGHIRPHSTQAEHPTHRGSRIVVRGKVFTAWAGKPVDGGSWDYYAKHRSQAEAIRRLLSEAERRES